MDSVVIAAASACWLGILTSISPCPLATNIAAITYIGKRVDRPAYVLSTGLLYTLGRTVTYVVLGVLIVAGALAISDLSFFLQRNMNKILGPILLLAGLVLLGTIKFNMSGPSFADRLQGKIEKYGLWGAGILGLLFALSFCPVSAALFFGSLIPLAVEQESSVLMPTLYGIGTALPVFVFATLIAVGARFVGVTYDRLATFEKWARRVTAVIFILVGIYYCLTYLFNVQVW
jgi:cytochrome c biogenesis protein CcdA